MQSIYDDVETKDIDGRSSPRQRAVTGMTFQRTGSAGEESYDDQPNFLMSPQGAKTISVVPDCEPWRSPNMNYSPNVYLTSNYDDYDP